MRVCVEAKVCPEQASAVKQPTVQWGGNSWGILLFLFAWPVLCPIYRCVCNVCPGTTAQRQGFSFAVFHVVVAFFPGYRGKYALDVIRSNTTDGQEASRQLHQNSLRHGAAGAACSLCLWHGIKVPAVRRCSSHCRLLLRSCFQRFLVLHHYVVQGVLVTSLVKHFSDSADSQKFGRGRRAACAGCAPASVKGSAV